METKAKYLLVGAFTILTILLLAGLLIFSSRNREETTRYVIYFSDGVAGLSTGNNVLFNGVPVGTVNSMELAEKDQSLVRVVIEISTRVIVRQDCRATLIPQGITGMTSIYIRGGSAGSPVLNTANDNNDDPLPVIPADPSLLQSLAGDVPALVREVSEAVSRANSLLSPKNVEHAGRALASLDNLSGALADESGDLKTFLGNMEQASAKLNILLDKADKLLDSDVHGALALLHQALNSVNSLVKNAESELRRFSGGSADNLSQLIIDLRSLSRDLSRLVREVNSNPRGFLFGSSVPEYKPAK